MTATSYHHQHQHQRHNCRPLKILNGDDDVIFTRFKSQIIAKRKSAVELLQETKPLYVKSEIVLDRKQELRRSLRGYHDDQIANDSIDPVISTKCNNISCPSDGYSAGHCCDSSAVEVGATRSFPVVKSPRLIPPPPAFRKSMNSVQLQNELRKLLNGDSKENLLETNSVIDGGGYSSTNKRKAVECDDSKFYNARVSKQMNSVCHKSLPDLTVDRDLSSAIEKNDNASYDPTLCSVSSDGVCKKSTHTDCISLASCKNDCLYASTDFSESHNDYDYFQDFADNTQESSPVKSCASFITPPPLYCDNTESSKNLSVLRSKSDVRVRTLSSLHLADIPPCDSSNLNLFFDNLGLESDEYNSLTAPRSNASSPTYFLSDSSVISIGECASGSDIPPSNHATQLPSIVERNARIIKWLCNCRKALEQIPRITVPQCR